MAEFIKSESKFKIVWSMFISLLLSLMISSLLVSISSLADSLCISRYLGDNAMAAYSLSKPVFKFFGIIAGIITSGLQIVLGAELGKGNIKNANKLFSFFFVLCFLIGIVIMILGVTIPKQLAFIFGAYDMNSELNQLAADFLKGILIGAPFLLIYSALLPIYSFMGARKLIMGCALLNALVDISFNILNGEVFKLGMFGMGLSTTLGYVVAVIPMVLFIVFKKSGIHFDFKGLSFKGKGHVFVCGLPKAFKSLSTSLKSVIVNTLILTIGGSVALTASGVEESLFGIINVLVSSLPSVFISLVSLYKLDNDKESCWHLLKIIAIYTIAIVVTVTVVIIIVAPYIIPIFNLQSKESFDTAVLAVRIGLIAVPLTVTNYLFLAYMQVIKKIRLSNFLNVMFYFVVPVLMTIIFGFSFKTVGLWIAVPVTELVNTLLVYTIRTIRHKKLSRIKDTLFTFEDDLKDDDLIQYGFQVYNLEDIEYNFKEIAKAFKEKGVEDDKLEKLETTCKVLLTNERLLNAKKVNKLNVDFLISLKNGEIKVRLRDISKDITPQMRADFIAKRREEAKENPDIIVLEDYLTKIQIVDVLNIHIFTFIIA